MWRLPRLSHKESTCQCRRCRRCGLDLRVWKISWRKKWQPTPGFLPEKSHGQRAWWATVRGVAKSKTQLRDWAPLSTRNMCALGSMQLRCDAETNELFVPVVCVGRLCLDKQSAIYSVHQCFSAFQNVPKPATTEIQCGGGERQSFCSYFFFFPYSCRAGLAGLLCGRDFSYALSWVLSTDSISDGQVNQVAFDTILRLYGT